MAIITDMEGYRKRQMSISDRDELRRLRREMELCSLGDRPQSMSAMKLQRLIDLEAEEIRAYAAANLPSVPSYTLAELEALAKEWRDQNHISVEIQFAVSHLLAWLARREKESIK